MHDNTEHVYTEACYPVVAAQEAATPQPTQPLTEDMMRKLRGQYFTVRHHRVQPCGHLLDQIMEPTFRNCQPCWFVFYNSHAQLVEVTDKALREQGKDFIIKMRGKQYFKMFTRFMSTIARLKKESDERARAEGTYNEEGEIQGSGGGREGVRQETGRDDIPTTGKQGQPSDS
jgi:hypothetical protein